MPKKKYFTQETLSKKFGYKDGNSFRSGKKHRKMMEGIKFVIETVEAVKDKEILDLKERINKLMENHGK